MYENVLYVLKNLHLVLKTVNLVSYMYKFKNCVIISI